jgi:Protein of unknown function (DUF2961)
MGGFDLFAVEHPHPMKILSLILFAAPLFAQYAPAPATSYTALKQIIDAKPAATSGAGAPSGNCTAGLDLYTNTSGPALYYCSATNVWTLIPTPTGNATTVNGAAVPASQPCVGTNSGSQFIPGTCGGPSGSINNSSVTLTGSEFTDTQVINASVAAGATQTLLNISPGTPGYIKLIHVTCDFFYISGSNTWNCPDSVLSIYIDGEVIPSFSSDMGNLCATHRANINASETWNTDHLHAEVNVGFNSTSCDIRYAVPFNSSVIATLTAAAGEAINSLYTDLYWTASSAFAPNTYKLYTSSINQLNAVTWTPTQQNAGSNFLSLASGSGWLVGQGLTMTGGTNETYLENTPAVLINGSSTVTMQANGGEDWPGSGFYFATAAIPYWNGYFAVTAQNNTGGGVFNTTYFLDLLSKWGGIKFDSGVVFGLRGVVGKSLPSSSTNINVSYAILYYAPFPGYYLSGPAGGALSTASTNFTITPVASYTGAITITPSGGGLSTPIVKTFAGSTPQTFTITPTAVGPVSLTPSNSGSLTNPQALSYATPPAAPTIGTATVSGTTASVPFTPGSTGGSGATYTPSCSLVAGGGTITGSAVTVSPGSVAGLTNAVAYNCLVTATNTYGTSPASANSNSITPSAASTYTYVTSAKVGVNGGTPLTTINTGSISLTAGDFVTIYLSGGNSIATPVCSTNNSDTVVVGTAQLDSGGDQSGVLAYILSAVGGATTVTCTLPSTTFSAITWGQFHHSGSTATLDGSIVSAVTVGGTSTTSASYSTVSSDLVVFCGVVSGGGASYSAGPAVGGVTPVSFTPSGAGSGCEYYQFASPQTSITATLQGNQSGNWPNARLAVK